MPKARRCGRWVMVALASGVFAGVLPDTAQAETPTSSTPGMGAAGSNQVPPPPGPPPPGPPPTVPGGVQVAPLPPAAPAAGASGSAGRWVPSPDGTTYVPVPAGYEAPLVLPYREGQPIPRGYRVVERPRKGLVVTGYVLSATGYGTAVLAAMASGFANESSWLLIPWVGPWLTLGFREYAECRNRQTSTDTTGSGTPTQDNDARDNDAQCASDALVLSGLIVDGIVQVTGGVLLLLGYTVTKQQLERSDYAWRVAPVPIAGGYGLTLAGWF